MNQSKRIFLWLLAIFLVYSLVRSIFSYQKRFQFYEDYKNSLEKEKKTNIELKTEIVKKKSGTEVEKTIRNKLNLLKKNEVALIIPSPNLTPHPSPTPILPNWKKWWKIFF